MIDGINEIVDNMLYFIFKVRLRHLVNPDEITDTWINNTILKINLSDSRYDALEKRCCSKVLDDLKNFLKEFSFQKLLPLKEELKSKILLKVNY